MMSDMDILREMIMDAAQEYLQYEDSKPMVILREPGVSGSNVTIRDLPPDALVIKVDAFFRQPDTIFKGDRGERRRADYVIISAERKRIIHIEMKRKKKEWHTIVQQLKGSQCFMAYCQKVGELFWNDGDFLSNYKNRFFSIRHTNSRKSATRSNKKNVPDTPDMAEKISKSNLKFNELAWLGAK